MDSLTVETEDSFASLLELAANNDVERFKDFIKNDISGTDEVGLWYSRQKGSKQLVHLHRTPLMVASTYGSIDIIKLIISISNADINKPCGVDKATSLHCAASGGSINVIDVVKLLLEAGADPNCVDANGNFPVDVIVVPPRLENLKNSLGELLRVPIGTNLRVSTSTSNSNSPPLSPDNGSPSSPLDSNSSPDSLKVNDVLGSASPYVSEKKEYPIDPSLPDIKNGIYSTDEFRMFSFKVRPCSRAYSHDWTECPFVHPGENARRRDPRKFHYSCVPCPDFRKGACRRGDMCEYAHGVFESWLHPAQYRTRICKDGTSCDRRVCFFAHTQEELRPLYMSTGSAVPSPRSGSAVSIDPFMLSPSSPFASPHSPSGNGMFSGQNVPALHLPGSVNFQSSRLRSSFNARDIQGDDMDLFLKELSRLSNPSKGLTPSNLDNLFLSESSSPRYSEPVFAPINVSFSPKSALLNQFQQQKNMLSPINTSFSPKSIDRSYTQSPFAGPSMSPRGVDQNLCNVKQDPISPMGPRVSMLREKQPLNFRSLSSRDLGSSRGDSLGDSWTNWGSAGGKADWTVNADEFGKLRRSSSFELKNNVEEPDFGWVHSLVKEENHQVNDGAGSSGDGSGLETIDQTVLGDWLEQMRFD